MQLLADGGELIVFPEGTSSLGPRHLPFKSGAVRIALDALAGGVPLRIVPLGIHYEGAWAFRSKVEVAVGESVSTELPAGLSELGRLKELKRRVTTALESVGTNFTSDEAQQNAERVAYAALRRGLRALGERLVQRGALAEPMDIFFAHQEQAERAMTADTREAWKEFAAQVREQKAAYLADQARRPEWILGQSEPAADAATGTRGVLTGLAGSPGVAEGQVYLVLTPDDFAKFPKGAVLVAHTTNPTWTPLFYSAVAVVTESGGPLSHGAVTAREMRIPAVMSVKESLTRLQNGQRVRVDGAAGRVELLP